MKATPRVRFDGDHLRQRLAGVRRRLRLVVATRGLGWGLTALLGTAILIGFLDWWLHLPALVRALALVGTLAGTGIVFHRYLLSPLRGRTDDLSLALRIEARYPSLNDALASTVQFLASPEAAAGTSEGIRQEAVRRALQKAEGCDFNRVVDDRGLRTASACGLLSVLAVTALALLQPTLAARALIRLADPFGGHEWHVTLIELDPLRDRIGREEVYEITGSLRGTIPGEIKVTFRADGDPHNGEKDHTFTDTEVALREPGLGRFKVVIPGDLIKRDFQFRVRAATATTPWTRVKVLPPPRLTAMQVQLYYPLYTGKNPEALPEESPSIDAPLGTLVSLRGSANRPLKSAWIEFRPSRPVDLLSACLASLGEMSLAALPALEAGSRVWGRHACKLEGDGSRFSLRIAPIIQGDWTLHLIDESGLHAAAGPWPIHIWRDESPEVKLERPEARREHLDVLPGAVLPLKVTIHDRQGSHRTGYGIRAVWLEYRLHNETAFRRLPLSHPGLACVDLWTAFPGWNWPKILPTPFKPLWLSLERSLPVSAFRRAGGEPVREKDVITLRACADDYDDIDLVKEPGRSADIELRIVSRPALEAKLDEDSKKLQEELKKQQDEQNRARKAIDQVLDAAGKDRPLTQQERAALLEAENTQQNIRKRLTTDPESARERATRILETLRQNGLERSALHDRMLLAEKELERLEREQLRQLDARLNDAVKQVDAPERSPARRHADRLRELAEESRRQSTALQDLARSASEREREGPEKDAQALQDHAAALEKMAQRLEKLAEEKARLTADQAQEMARELERLSAEQERLANNQNSRARQDQSGKDQDWARQGRALRQLSQRLQDEARAVNESAQAGDGNPLRDTLEESQRRQREVHRTLTELLDRLRPWNDVQQMRSEASGLLEEQKNLLDRVEQMKKDGQLGIEPEQLNREQKSRLDRAVKDQKLLTERAKQFLERLRELADEREKKEPGSAGDLRAALKQASDDNLAGDLREAQDDLERNQLANAAKNQQKAIQTLNKVVEKLKDRRDLEMERLLARSREFQERLEELADDQDRLRRRIRTAEQKEGEHKAEELRKLARDQKRLQQEAEDLADRAARMGADRTARALEQAARQMAEDVRRLERGQAPDRPRQDALDRLDDALDDLDRQVEKQEDALAREQLARVAEMLEPLHRRQLALQAEHARLVEEAKKAGAWKEELLEALSDLARNQEGLAQEARSLANRELNGSKLFARLLLRAADAMDEASAAIAEYRQARLEKPGELAPSAAVQSAQAQAVRLLGQLVEALKPPADEMLKPAQRPQQQPRQGQEQPDAGPPPDGIPPLAQLKLLRNLQADLKKRTEEFHARNPDKMKLTEEQRKQLQTLEKDQKEVADLVESFLRGGQGGGLER